MNRFELHLAVVIEQRLVLVLAEVKLQRGLNKQRAP
jgi:hypothetical protein